MIAGVATSKTDWKVHIAHMASGSRGLTSDRIGFSVYMNVIGVDMLVGPEYSTMTLKLRFAKLSSGALGTMIVIASGLLKKIINVKCKCTTHLLSAP